MLFLANPRLESNSESRMISLFYESHSTFLAGSQETTSCRIRTGNGATVNRILNELIENLVAIAYEIVVVVLLLQKLVDLVGKISSHFCIMTQICQKNFLFLYRSFANINRYRFVIQKNI